MIWKAKLNKAEIWMITDSEKCIKRHANADRRAAKNSLKIMCHHRVTTMYNIANIPILVCAVDGKIALLLKSLLNQLQTPLFGFGVSKLCIT